MAQYLKPDCELGYIEDPAEIEKLKIDNARHTILGCMLGDFDETGAYVVDPEIVKELIEMPKFIVETMDNIEICKSCLKLDKHISFMVTFEGNKASLILVEKLSYEANFAINSGTYSNINEYVLDSVETSGEINRNAIYMRWNIGNFGGDVLDIFSCDPEVLAKYFGIVNRFKYLLHANKILLDKEDVLEEVESSYTNEMFEILKHYPKLNDAVMAQIAKTLEEKKNAISVHKPNFAKTFNELLENCILHNLEVLTEDQLREFTAEKRNAEVNLNIKRAETFETEIVSAFENDKVENSPRIIRFKVDEAYTVRTITELAEEFLEANKNVEERKRDILQDPSSEKGQLVATLVGAGVGSFIGGTAGAVFGAAAANLIVETAEKIIEVKKSNAVRPAKGQQQSRGAAGNRSAVGKKDGETKSSKHLTKRERDAIAAAEKESRRIYGIYQGGGASSGGGSGPQKESPIEKYEMTPEQVMEREREMLEEINGNTSTEKDIIKGKPEAQNAAVRRLLKNEGQNASEVVQATTLIGKQEIIAKTTEVEVIAEETIIATRMAKGPTPMTDQTKKGSQVSELNTEGLSI